MAGFFPQDWLDELMGRNDIIDVVNAYVPLTKKGKKHWGLCPFHSEKTASFSVDEDRQLYYCFGCKAGGNVIHFIMNLEKLEFREAVQLLAERAGMQLPQMVNSEAADKARAERQRLYDLVREAARYYNMALITEPGERARTYLAKRGISPATITRFGMGYADESWDGITKHLMEKGFSVEEIEKAGLCITRRGKSFDFFRDRIMFPIIDQYGKVLGFGGRVIDTDGPKYINSPDTLIYNKRQMLYGLNFHKSFPNDRKLITVEGYMDLIAVANAGIPNVVANLGTSLTKEQARMMRRFADTIYIAYDGDSAGQTATLRGLDIIAGEGLDVRVIRLPEGMDPDDFIKANGPSGFRNAMADAITLMEFKLWMLSNESDMDSENGRMEFAKKACVLLRGLEPIEMERYMKQVAGMTGFSVDTVREQVAGGKPDKNTTRFKRNTNTKNEKPTDEKREKKLVALCANRDAYAKKAMRWISPDDFLDENCKRIWQIMVTLFREEITPVAILNRIEDGALAQAAAEMLQEEIGDIDNEASLQDLCKRILMDKLENDSVLLRKKLVEYQGDKKERDRLIGEQVWMDNARQELQKGIFPTRRAEL
ncbi:DNA primase [Eubacteriales bacterium OttesenSCG-928-M02]|nr:DNA primase [Eubacteriales bacterium OttesenSCG-928-M02]